MENKLTQEWIDQFNRKCAKFLNITTDNGRWVEFDKEIPNYITCSYSKRHHIEQLCFHKDWNWIMGVVEIIQNLYSLESDCEEGKQLVYTINHWLVRRHKTLTKKEAVVQAIDQFIDWYNKNKNGE